MSKELASLERKKGAMENDKLHTMKVVSSWILIVLGFITILETVFFAYIRQYIEYQINGHSFTNALTYLQYFPLNTILVVAVVFVTTGVFLLWKTIKTVYRKDKNNA